MIGRTDISESTRKANLPKHSEDSQDDRSSSHPEQSVFTMSKDNISSSSPINAALADICRWSATKGSL